MSSFAKSHGHLFNRDTGHYNSVVTTLSMFQWPRTEDGGQRVIKQQPRDGDNIEERFDGMNSLQLPLV